ncbi:hypothetical protein Q3C01_09365 [Bradyrhizobium sp. UFLA05-109]
MKRSPSIVTNALARGDVYLVLEDFGGGLGRAWCETAEEDTGRATLLRHLTEGQYEHPVRIIVFNTTQGWSRDVTAEIADELRRRLLELGDVTPSLLDFVERAMRH